MQLLTDGFGDVQHGHAILGNGMQSGPCGSVLEGESVEHSGVRGIDCWQPVVAAAQKPRDAGRPRHRDQPGREGREGRSAERAAVGDGRDPDHRGPDAAIGEADDEVLCVRSRTRLQEVLLRPCATEAGEHQCPGGSHERLAGSDQCFSDCLDGGEVRGHGAREVARQHPIAVEREVDDAIGLRRRPAQAVELVEVTAPGLRSERRELRRGQVGPGEADDVVTRGDQFADDHRSDVAGAAGEEDVHGGLLGVECLGKAGAQAAAVTTAPVPGRR